MSESNRVAVRYDAESTWGETDSGPPTLKDIRRTGGSFTPGLVFSQSQEVRSDRMVADQIRTGLNPSGTIDYESSYAAHHDLYEGVFCSTWLAAETTTAALTTVKAAKTVAMTAAFTNLVVGDWFEIAGSAANNGFFKIATRADADGVTVENDEDLGADATAEASVTISNDGRLKNGTTRKSFTVEEDYLDITQFMIYRGVTFGSMTINVSAEALVSGSFGDILAGSKKTLGTGTGAVERRATTVGDGSPTAAPTNDVLSAIADVVGIREGGNASTYLLQDFSITIQNNLRARNCVGNLGPCDIKLGTVNVTGNFNVYWGDGSEALVDKLIAATETSMSFQFTDGAGNREIWSIDSMKYDGGGPEAGGLDSDVPTNMTFAAMLKTGGATMIQVDRFAV